MRWFECGVWQLNLRHMSLSVPQHQLLVFNSLKSCNSSCVGPSLRSGAPFVTQHIEAVGPADIYGRK